MHLDFMASPSINAERDSLFVIVFSIFSLLYVFGLSVVFGSMFLRYFDYLLSISSANFVL